VPHTTGFLPEANGNRLDASTVRVRGIQLQQAEEKHLAQCFKAPHVAQLREAAQESVEGITVQGQQHSIRERLYIRCSHILQAAHCCTTNVLYASTIVQQRRQPVWHAWCRRASSPKQDPLVTRASSTPALSNMVKAPSSMT
jgi:hypothetical protein